MKADFRESIPQAELLVSETLRRHLGPLDDPTGLVERAFAIAAEAHAPHFRRGGEPYLVHPARVAICLRHELGCADPEGLATSLVHDVLEDAPEWDGEALRSRLGDRVLAMTEALTEDTSLERPHRYQVYWERLAAAEELARLVKVADRVDNLRDALALEGATADFLRKNVFRTRMRFIPFLEECGTPGGELLDEACGAIERHLAIMEGRDPAVSTLCPVCGWDLAGQTVGAGGQSTCPSCGFTFGRDDQPGATGAISAVQAQARWRWYWLQEGSPWRGAGQPPMGWNALAQLARIGVRPPSD